MKYLLSILFIILSVNSHAEKLELKCVKIEYKAGSSIFNDRSKKLEARKKYLNKAFDNELIVKDTIYKVGLTKDLGCQVATGIALQSFVDGKNVSDIKSGSTANKSSRGNNSNTKGEKHLKTQRNKIFKYKDRGFINNYGSHYNSPLLLY